MSREGYKDFSLKGDLVAEVLKIVDHGHMGYETPTDFVRSAVREQIRRDHEELGWTVSGAPRQPNQTALDEHEVE